MHMQYVSLQAPRETNKGVFGSAFAYYSCVASCFERKTHHMWPIDELVNQSPTSLWLLRIIWLNWNETPSDADDRWVTKTANTDIFINKWKKKKKIIPSVLLLWGQQSIFFFFLRMTDYMWSCQVTEAIMTSCNRAQLTSSQRWQNAFHISIVYAYTPNCPSNYHPFLSNEKITSIWLNTFQTYLASLVLHKQQQGHKRGFGSDQQLGKVNWSKKEIKDFDWARLRLAS